jgi:prophage regulatory protein
MHPLDHSTERLIRLPEVLTLTGLPKSTLYNMVRQGRFPKPQKMGRISLWRLSDVNRFVTDPSSYASILPQDKEGSPPANRGSLDLERTSAEDSRA